MSGSLSFGYFAYQQAPDDEHCTNLVDEMVAEAQAAETSGFSGVFVSEHHQRTDNYVPSPLVLAALLAHETSRVDVGTAVALLPLYNPLRLVEDVTCLDIVARGRFVLGLGAGYVPEDLALYGMEKAEAVDRYEEGLQIVAHGWEREWSYDGRWYKAHVGELRPRPVSAPRPRVWIGGHSPAGVRRAARYGDAWIVGADMSLGDATRLAAVYRNACVIAGKSPQVAVIRDAWLADSDRDAFEQCAVPLLGRFRQLLQRDFVSDPRVRELDPIAPAFERFYDIAADRWLIGREERIAALLAAWQAQVGASYFLLRFRHPNGPSHEVVLEQIERFAWTFAERGQPRGSGSDT